MFKFIANVVRRLIKGDVSEPLPEEENMSTKNMTDDLASAMTKRLKARAIEEESSSEDPMAHIETGQASRKQKKRSAEDVDLYYAKDGRIHKTHLFTEDTEAILAWANFVHPILSHHPDDLRTIATDVEARTQLYTILQQGVSLYNTWLRSPGEGVPRPHTDKGKGH